MLGLVKKYEDEPGGTPAPSLASKIFGLAKNMLRVGPLGNTLKGNLESEGLPVLVKGGDVTLGDGPDNLES
jgi:hypothetical protein